MHGGKKYPVEIDLIDRRSQHVITVKIDVIDHNLGRKWIQALDHVLFNELHLEKNYCFLGFADSDRDGQMILDRVNTSIFYINDADIGYHIDDWFTMANTMTDEPQGNRTKGRNIVQHRLNMLHRYFEDLQGSSGRMSDFYIKADHEIRWHIRQLNLLCHEFESWALSYRKQIEAPDWQRPSQLMCWLSAPRFALEIEDLDLFGVDTINRDLGGVYIGVNKAVGKHHWEVFQDEGRDSRIGELTTSALRNQSEAAADFDIEWGRNPKDFPWQTKMLEDFRHWLTINGFDPEDPELTIGHPKIAQVDLKVSFGTEDPQKIWAMLNQHLDVSEVRTLRHRAHYAYHWSDEDYIQRQIEILKQG